jgi:hypothetical protein
MGLDMFAYSVKPENDSDVSDLEYAEGERTEIAYWRKFNAFHAWMETLYKSKGGTDSFNCVPVRLRLEDLNQLESDISNLKPAEGFFFGPQEIYPEDVDRLYLFIEDARDIINSGNMVYYNSWW